MKNRNYERRSRASIGPLTRYLLAVIFPIALSMSSCCGTKQIVQSSQQQIRDSVVIREVLEVIPVTIPESKVEITIPTESLRNLPEGASFTEKQGQASVEVVYVNVPGETEYIIVTATCDSLQVLCNNLQREIYQLREDTEIEKSEIKTDNFKSGFRWGAISAALLAVLLVLAWTAIKRKIKL